ncbi:MAG: hypothetical protein WA290_22920 [Mycobacterium sp.]|uniref:hypothetical protein n=3 Tax=Mycobacterium sp. TaxID=1785 RepID=UPI003C79379B
MPTRADPTRPSAMAGRIAAASAGVKLLPWARSPTAPDSTALVSARSSAAMSKHRCTAVVEIHELASNEIVVIYLRNPDGLPIPFNKDGQHPGSDGKTITVFCKGEIFIREGAENVPIRYAHWTGLLSAYARGIRDQSNDAALTILREVLDGRGDARPDAAGVPLLMDMDEATFTATAIRLFETGNNVRLRQFIRTLSRSTGIAVGLPEFRAAADRWAIFCAQALHFGRPDLADEAIDKLCEAYKVLVIRLHSKSR